MWEQKHGGRDICSNLPGSSVASALAPPVMADSKYRQNMCVGYPESMWWCGGSTVGLGMRRPYFKFPLDYVRSLGGLGLITLLI